MAGPSIVQNRRQCSFLTSPGASPEPCGPVPAKQTSGFHSGPPCALIMPVNRRFRDVVQWGAGEGPPLSLGADLAAPCHFPNVSG